MLGSTPQARGGELRVLASGPDEASAVCEPVFSAIATRTFWLGEAGRGSRMKLVFQGWLLTPRAQPPHPLILNVHGGPVWQMRPLWLGRLSAAMLLLLEHGYAVFYPNPRGSSGFG